jgi:RNA polymerase sigma-70 factor, ECF subfamily
MSVDANADGNEQALAFKAGDDQAFAALVEIYQERFYRVAYRVLGDPDEALDVVQDGFVKIHNRIGSWDGQARFASWAYRIITNLAIDGLRRRGRERKAWETKAQERTEVEEDCTQDALVAQERQHLLGQVKDAIADLPPGQRTVVALRHYEGFSLKEIAEARGCALGTVKSTLHQAFRSLRRTLGAELLEQVAVSRSG